jgi:Isochorismatase family
MHTRKGTSAWDQLSIDSAQLLLCDLQPEIIARGRTNDRDALSKSAGVLLEIAKLFSLPTTLSVVPEGDKAPELISELRGSGFAQEKLRASASPFFDAATKNLLAQSRRKVLIIGGFATEAVVLHAVLDARAQAYEVLVPVDVCGGMSERTEQAALRQIIAAGAITTSVVSIATKLAPDFTTDLGKELFNIVQRLRLP